MGGLNRNGKKFRICMGGREVIARSPSRSLTRDSSVAAAGRHRGYAHFSCQNYLTGMPATFVAGMIDRLFRRSGSLIQERGVAPRGGGIDRQRALAGKSSKVMRAAGLRARSRKPCPAERLHADHGSDHVSIDIGIADGCVGKYLAPKRF